jgi:hypothetical protein
VVVGCGVTVPVAFTCVGAVCAKDSEIRLEKKEAKSKCPISLLNMEISFLKRPRRDV